MTRRRVREAVPLQVYLVADERERLERLADQLDATKSDVIRRGLLALEREMTSPASHPALRLIGIAETELANATPSDAAREHDRLLADAEEAGWSAPKPPRVVRETTGKKKRRGR